MASQDLRSSTVGKAIPWGCSPVVALYKARFSASDVTTLGTSDVYQIINLPATKCIIIAAWMDVITASASGSLGLTDGTNTWFTGAAITTTGIKMDATNYPRQEAADGVLTLTVSSAAVAATTEVDVYALVVDLDSNG